MKGLALGVVGLWVILQTTFGPLATKLGLITSGGGLTPGSTIPPGTQPGNPQGIAAIQPTTAPPGQTGTFGIDQNGDLYKKVNGQWVPWGTSATAPGLA